MFREWMEKFNGEFNSFLPISDRGIVTEETIRAGVLIDLAALGLSPKQSARLMLEGAIFEATEGRFSRDEITHKMICLKRVYRLK